MCIRACATWSLRNFLPIFYWSYIKILFNYIKSCYIDCWWETEITPQSWEYISQIDRNNEHFKALQNCFILVMYKIQLFLESIKEWDEILFPFTFLSSSLFFAIMCEYVLWIYPRSKFILMMSMLVHYTLKVIRMSVINLKS